MQLVYAFGLVWGCGLASREGGDADEEVMAVARAAI